MAKDCKIVLAIFEILHHLPGSSCDGRVKLLTLLTLALKAKDGVKGDELL